MNLCGLSEFSFAGEAKGKEVSPEDEPRFRSKVHEELLISPFIRYDDNYHWPSLYSEANEMIETSSLIYLLSELRTKARKGDLPSGAENVLSTPLTYAQILETVEMNSETLAGSELGSDVFNNILEATRERNITTSSVTPSQIVAFDDEFATEELVYSVDVTHSRRRVTVCFRGSTNRIDWTANLQVHMKKVDNPCKDATGQDSVVRVHSGYYNYLFTPSLRGTKGENDEDLSEYEEIMTVVLPIVKKYPNYKVYVTGHSLGGALATLFAFELAALPDDTVPKPVSLFSIASPYVGDSSFRSAHQLLESRGKLRHLRLTNHKDIATLFPGLSMRWNVFHKESSVGTLFKHVGINMRLYEGVNSFELSYPRVTGGVFSSFMDGLARGWDQTLMSNLTLWPGSYVTVHHALGEYGKRLDANKVAVEAVQLNDLYSRKDIVGNLVPQF